MNFDVDVDHGHDSEGIWSQDDNDLEQEEDDFSAQLNAAILSHDASHASHFLASYAAENWHSALETIFSTKSFPRIVNMSVEMFRVFVEFGADIRIFIQVSSWLCFLETRS